MAKLHLLAYEQRVTLPSVYLITAMVENTVQIIYFLKNSIILIIFTSLRSTVTKIFILLQVFLQRG